MPLFGVPGERTGYEVYPNPEGPPLVLIHGFTTSRASFEVNIAELQKHFTVIAVELLGHGDSDAPENADAYEPRRAVRRVLQLLEHLGYQRALICGHSLGGALALRIALDAPEWVAGLVVINSNSAAGTPEWREVASANMRSIGARVRSEGTAFMKNTRLYPAHSKRLDAKSRELLTRDFDRLQPAGLAGTAEALTVDVNVYERHPTLTVPMLLVVGDKDTEFAPNATPFLARFPQHLVREVHLPNAGHAANIEQPREFEAAVVAFAQEIAYLKRPGSGIADGNRMLTAFGGALVVAGLGLLGAALFFNGGDSNGGNSNLVAAAPEETRAPATQTQVQGVAGTRAPGVVGVSTPAQGSATAVAASSSVAALATATVAPTQAPATATRRPATATPEPADTPEPTPTPESTPTTAATATPSGPKARINGPATGEAGSVLVFSDSSSPAPITREWTLPNGAIVTHSPGASFTPPTPGCYVVTMTAYFTGGVVQQTSHAVSVGGVSCGGSG